uniref:Expansin-like EG45 domain-containing protein n=1 Tax=Salix viminalis TaxID=40686 RepID=A0A6N2MQS4_SALVM
MGFNIGSVFIMVGIVSCLISVAHAAQGNGVFYDPPYTPSKCFGNSNKGGLVAGVSDALWNGGAACGRRYRVSCVRGTNKAPKPCRQGSVVGLKTFNGGGKSCFKAELIVIDRV